MKALCSRRGYGNSQPLQVSFNKAKGYVCVFSTRTPSSCGKLPSHAEAHGARIALKLFWCHLTFKSVYVSMVSRLKDSESTRGH